MSYTDIVTVLSYADTDAYSLAQEWLDAAAAHEEWKRLCAAIRAMVA